MQGGLKMLSIQLDSIESSRIVSPCVRLVSIRYTGSRFARDKKYSIPAVYGRLKILSIRLDSIESTRIVCPCGDSLYWESTCAGLGNYYCLVLCRVSENFAIRVDSIESTGIGFPSSFFKSFCRMSIRARLRK